MVDICSNLRLIKRTGFNGNTWICQQLCPAETWKNRQVWKPVTRPLYHAEVVDWLTHQAFGAEAIEQFNHAVD